MLIVIHRDLKSHAKLASEDLIMRLSNHWNLRDKITTLHDGFEIRVDDVTVLIRCGDPIKYLQGMRPEYYNVDSHHAADVILAHTPPGNTLYELNSIQKIENEIVKHLKDSCPFSSQLKIDGEDCGIMAFCTECEYWKNYDKCRVCNGTGLVSLGDGIRGVKKCVCCKGTGRKDVR